MVFGDAFEFENDVGKNVLCVVEVRDQYIQYPAIYRLPSPICLEGGSAHYEWQS